jgi:hypothetical protein
MTRTHVRTGAASTSTAELRKRSYADVPIGVLDPQNKGPDGRSGFGPVRTAVPNTTVRLYCYSEVPAFHVGLGSRVLAEVEHPQVIQLHPMSEVNTQKEGGS